MYRSAAFLLLVTAAAIAITTTAPLAAADPANELAAAVATERAAAHCPPLQSDPLVTRVAQLASENTREYAVFRTAAVPFTDPLPALATVGHPASKAILLSGYGSSAADALRGVVLNYRAAQPDCTFTQSGTDVQQDDTGAYIASVVLATP